MSARLLRGGGQNGPAPALEGLRGNTSSLSQDQPGLRRYYGPHGLIPGPPWHRKLLTTTLAYSKAALGAIRDNSGLYKDPKGTLLVVPQVSADPIEGK
jgi:hypothetical protein